TAVRLAIERGLGRQAELRNPRAVAHDVGALDNVPQLAHVARPTVALQPLECGRRERLGLRGTLVELLEEMLRKKLDIAVALAQRRHEQRKHLETVKQVAPQPACIARLL